MHPDEPRTDAALVQRLLAAQLPHLAALPVVPVASSGTDNALYRLGDDLVVRLPRATWAVDDVAKEQRWLPVLAPHLPLPVPVPVGRGVPGEGYPWPWSVYRWLPGDDASGGGLRDLTGRPSSSRASSGRCSGSPRRTGRDRAPRGAACRSPCATR